MNQEIVKNANVSNKPMTKLQIEYFTNRIDRLTNEKRRSLESEFESEIQKESKNNYNKFIDTLKIKPQIDDFKDSTANYESTQKKLNEVERKHSKEIELLKVKHEMEIVKLEKVKDKQGKDLNDKRDVLYESLDNWNKIRQWKIYRFNLDSINELESDLRSACYDETKTAFYKSTAGKELKAIDDVQINILDHIHSNNLDKDILTVIGSNLSKIGINTQLQLTN
tara:strand:- start:1401 stop:2072 length:672 start_codon:yes stop_codon:yes gene_type:complete